MNVGINKQDVTDGPVLEDVARSNDDLFTKI